MKKKSILLTEGKHFTPSALVRYLNDEFDGKRNGSDFTIRDVYQYTRRQKLPNVYGGHSLSTIKNESIGLNIIKVESDA